MVEILWQFFVMFATEDFFLRFLGKLEYFLEILIYRLKDVSKKSFLKKKEDNRCFGSKDTAR
jgi:hypothetical protein